MKRLGLNLTAATLCFAFGLLAAASWGFVAQQQGAGFHAPATSLPAVPLRPETDVRYLPDSPIRRVDFLNFTYRGAKGAVYRDSLKTFTLVNGEYDDYPRWAVSGESGNITYADVTGDGEEEALIALFVQSSPSGGVHFLYVYTMARGKPMLLRFFKTHASGTDIGGLKDLYASDGDLAVELYGTNEILDDGSTFVLSGDCGDQLGIFTRARFHWDGKKFRRKGKFEVRSLTGKRD